jgi:hypothetical protein
MAAAGTIVCEKTIDVATSSPARSTAAVSCEPNEQFIIRRVEMLSSNLMTNGGNALYISVAVS